MRKIIIILIFLPFFSSFVSAQDEQCAFVLREAEKLYNQGLIEEIPNMLSDCINKGFSKEQRLEAYKLIVLSYLFDDQGEKADSSMRFFLNRYPEYEIQPTDPLEFRYLFNSYKTYPLVNLGVNFGVNISNMLVSQNLSGLNQTAGTTEYFTTPGISFGISTVWYLSPRLNLGFDVNYNQVEYTTFDSIGFLSKNRTIEFIERQSFIASPVTLMYKFNPWGRFVPILRMGGSVSYLLSSEGSVYVRYTDNSFNNDQSITDTDLLALRNKLLYHANAGVGLRYNIKKGFLFFDARYNFNLNTQLNEESLYDYNNLLFETGFLSDDFRLNNLAISVGYVYSFYVTKKIK